MKERICRVFIFSSCTTAPGTGLPAASVTMPLMVFSAGALFFCAKANEASATTNRAAANCFSMIRLSLTASWLSYGLVCRVAYGVELAGGALRFARDAEGTAVVDELVGEENPAVGGDD